MQKKKHMVVTKNLKKKLMEMDKKKHINYNTS